MIETTVNVHEALQRYFGFDSFKGTQEAIIENVLEGRDTFVIMPTGGGKSLCYQLPALMLGGTALIISPLIALMKNQVDSVRAHSQSDEIAHFLNSSLTKVQTKKVKKDLLEQKTKLLFVAPETLTKEENIAFFKQIDISFVAVDEAHCISEWGHDFRPEYRRIREMMDCIGSNIPFIALTATATPKVQSDIVKNLELRNPKVFISSFNRDNLYYEVRPKGKKEKVNTDLIRFVKENQGKSGIVYVQSRKNTEALARLLKVNDIKALPYHAGLDAKTRSATQDAFLMEKIDVIVATIAFGMGIDKPDIRFVVHYDIPKSIENYYQETGRAGRDGLGGSCLTFYSPKDIAKLEKLQRDKPVAEREMSSQLMTEMMGYADTSACRRRFLLHYFGEEFNAQKCDKKCDNCRHPKEQIEVKDEMVKGLKAILTLKENNRIKPVVNFIIGRISREIVDFGLNLLDDFGVGQHKDDHFWHSILRHALLNNLIYRDIENYGLLKMTEKGHNYIRKPYSFKMALNHNYDAEMAASASEGASAKTAVLDPVLLKMLKDLRRQVSKEKNVPPFVIFQDPSLEDMAIQYPSSMEGMVKITGVSKGKALRYGKEFIGLIADYMEENDIERPTDILIKSIVNKSSQKVHIIQSIDRKIPLPEIARGRNMSMEDLLHEIEMIVGSGTKININYYIDDYVDEYAQEEIHDYFMEAETDCLRTAVDALEEEDINVEEIQLMRIKFISDMGN